MGQAPLASASPFRATGAATCLPDHRCATCSLCRRSCGSDASAATTPDKQQPLMALRDLSVEVCPSDLIIINTLFRSASGPPRHFTFILDVDIQSFPDTVSHGLAASDRRPVRGKPMAVSEASMTRSSARQHGCSLGMLEMYDLFGRRLALP
jgi:hypothetical protein